MKIFVLCGIPASGKTTLAKQLARQHHAVVHSFDDIPDSWNNPDLDGTIRRKWMENIRSDLRNGNSVVCDCIALTSMSRKWILENVSDFDCEKILCVKAVPVEVCLERNQNRFRKVPDDHIRLTARMLEAPTKDEGWDKIFVYRD